MTLQANKTIAPVYLVDLIDELIGPKEYAEIRCKSILQVIEVLNGDDLHCHIEYPGKDNPHFKFPRIYHRKVWAVCAARHLREKEESAREREINCIRNDAWHGIRNKLAVILGANLNNKSHRERIHKVTQSLIDAKAKGVKELFGIDLASLPDSPYKKYTRI